MAHVHFADPLEQGSSKISPNESKEIRSILKPDLPTSSDKKRAGIEFSVGLVHHQLQSCVSPYQEISRQTSVYLAAVLEYLVAEMLHAAAMTANESREKEIRPVHLQWALKNDDELRCLVTRQPTDGSCSSNSQDSRPQYSTGGESLPLPRGSSKVLQPHQSWTGRIICRGISVNGRIHTLQRRGAAWSVINEGAVVAHRPSPSLLVLGKKSC